MQVEDLYLPSCSNPIKEPLYGLLGMADVVGDLRQEPPIPVVRNVIMICQAYCIPDPLRD